MKLFAVLVMIACLFVACAPVYPTVSEPVKEAVVVPQASTEATFLKQIPGFLVYKIEVDIRECLIFVDVYFYGQEARHQETCWFK